LQELNKSFKFLGILGGGQLGQFFTMAAQKMGHAVVVFDPDKKSPAGKLADKHICRSYDDLEALDELKKICNLVTTEFENIPAETLRYLEKDVIVRPKAKAVSIAQNRIKEKSFLKQSGIPIGRHAVIDNFKSIKLLNDEVDMFPAILKTAQFGYDGKGQIHVNDVKELERAFVRFKKVPCILEEKLDLDLEFSIVMARSINGDYLEYPLIENQHEAGILDLSIIPARIPSIIKKEATKLAKKIASDLNYIGVMAVEFFISNNHLYVNEIAPRPHNSGHFSIDACVYNQFDQQVLTLAGSRPKDEETKFPVSVMLNLLGDLWFRKGEKKSEPNFEMIKSSEIKIHLYGKYEPRIGRKMGHITILGLEKQSIDDVIRKAESIRKTIWEN